MRFFKKILVMTVFASALMFSACCVAKQPYTRAEFEAARMEMVTEQNRTVTLTQIKNDLEAQLAAKRAKLQFFLDWENELKK